MEKNNYTGRIFTPSGELKKGIVETCNSIITKITYDESITSDRIIIPGLIDIHLHGANGYDICDGTAEAFSGIAKYERENGIVTFLGATMTVSYDEIKTIIETAKCINEEEFKGIYLEGPFISKEYAGAQKREEILKPEKENIDKIIKLGKDGDSRNIIKLMVMAPEEIEEENIIEEIINNNIKVSLGHSSCDYKMAMKAFGEGADHVTHLYNAMRDTLKREPGIPGAAFDSNAYIELIADGNHISDTVLRMTFSAYKEDRIILVSDSMRGTGLEDGEYTLGGQKVLVESVEQDNAVKGEWNAANKVKGEWNVANKVKGEWNAANKVKRITRVARLENGALAGSVANLHQCLLNAIGAGVPFEKAVKAATINPAKRLGIDNKYGTIEIGKYEPVYL